MRGKPQKLDTGPIKEASLTAQRLNSEKAELWLQQLRDLVALDLSHNVVTRLPKGFPPSLIALDLSHNAVVSFRPTHRLANLVELKLSHNRIDSTLGLMHCTALEYLDLSYNKIVTIAGLEMLARLKLLHVEHNKVAAVSALRPLSLNTRLQNLSLKGNPVTAVANYRTTVLSFVGADVKFLDGAVVSHRSCKLDVGYTDGYVHLGAGGGGGGRNHGHGRRDGDSDVNNTSLASSHTSWVLHGPPLHGHGHVHEDPYDRRPWSAQAPRAGASSLSSWSVDADRLHDGAGASLPWGLPPDDYDDDVSQRARSPIPWRNPPLIVPRDRKGNPMRSPSASRERRHGHGNGHGGGLEHSFHGHSHTPLAPSRPSSAPRGRTRSLSPPGSHGGAHQARPRSAPPSRVPSPSPSWHAESASGHHPHPHHQPGSGNRGHRGSSPTSEHGAHDPMHPHMHPLWTSPSLRRGDRAQNSILERLPLSPSRPRSASLSSAHSHRKGPARPMSASRSVVDDSVLSEPDYHPSSYYYHQQPRYETPSYGHGARHAYSHNSHSSHHHQHHYSADDRSRSVVDDSASYTAAEPYPLDSGDSYYLPAAAGVAGADASSALAALEAQWHEELIAEAKRLAAAEEHATQTQAQAQAAVSATLQNRAALLRAIHSAARLRERQEREREEQRRRLPPPPLGAREVDWGHHHSGGKTPAYHRMSYHKAAFGRQPGGGSVAHAAAAAEATVAAARGVDEEKYERAAPRTQERPSSAPPAAAAAAYRNPSHGHGHDVRTMGVSTGTDHDVIEGVAAVVAAAAAAAGVAYDDGELGPQSQSQSQSGDEGGLGGQRKDQVPLPDLPVLGRGAGTPPSQPGLPRAATGPGLDSTRSAARTSLSARPSSARRPPPAPSSSSAGRYSSSSSSSSSSAPRALNDSLDGIEELERLLLSSDDANASGGADEIARLKEAMAAIMERRQESIDLLQKSIGTSSTATAGGGGGGEDRTNPAAGDDPIFDLEEKR